MSLSSIDRIGKPFVVRCPGLTATPSPRPDLCASRSGIGFAGGFEGIDVENLICLNATLDLIVATLSMRTACNGQYPFAGTYKDDQLVVRATQKGGPAGDCDFGFRGKREGDTLVGTIGKYEITLRK